MTSKPKQYRPKRSNGNRKYNGKKRWKKTNKLYNNEWRVYTYRFKYYNPNCYVCSAPTQHVDHIVAAKGDENLFWDLTNHMPLCEGCHNYITSMFDRHKPPRTEEKMKWVDSQRRLFNTQVKVKVISREPSKKGNKK